MHGRITVGNGKWYLSDIIMALNLLRIKHTVIGGACCLDKGQKRSICVERCPTIRPAETSDIFLLVSGREHVYCYGIYSVWWPTHTTAMAVLLRNLLRLLANTHDSHGCIITEFTPSAGQHTRQPRLYYYGIYSVCWPTDTTAMAVWAPSEPCSSFKCVPDTFPNSFRRVLKTAKSD